MFIQTQFPETQGIKITNNIMFVKNATKGVSMVLKSSEKELERKAEYYKKNKEKILERKHSRQDIIYSNKVNRMLVSDDEWEKEQMRKLSKLDNVRPLACEMCRIAADKLDHLLELHHLDYAETQGVWVCKTCHAQLDKVRRRQ